MYSRRKKSATGLKPSTLDTSAILAVQPYLPWNTKAYGSWNAKTKLREASRGYDRVLTPFWLLNRTRWESKRCLPFAAEELRSNVSESPRQDDLLYGFSITPVFPEHVEHLKHVATGMYVREPEERVVIEHTSAYTSDFPFIKEGHV